MLCEMVCCHELYVSTLLSWIFYLLVPPVLKIEYSICVHRKIQYSICTLLNIYIYIYFKKKFWLVFEVTLVFDYPSISAMTELILEGDWVRKNWVSPGGQKMTLPSSTRQKTRLELSREKRCCLSVKSNFCATDIPKKSRHFDSFDQLLA